MTIKYFCDVCGIEVSDPSFSLDMTGKVLCWNHFRQHEKKTRKKWVWKGNNKPKRLLHDFYEIDTYGDKK